MQPEAILFDCGGTLSWPPFDRLDAILSDLRGKAIGIEAHYRAFYRGTHALDDFLRANNGRYPVGDSFSLNHWVYEQGVAREGFAGLWTRECTHEVLKREKRLGRWDYTFDWVGDCLQRFSDTELRMGIVSNADGHVAELLKQLEYAQYFEVIVDSFIEQVYKPDPQLFYIGLERMGLASLADQAKLVAAGTGGQPKVLYVGDSYRSDIVGARRAGIAVKLIDPLDLYADWECERVSDLREFCDGVLADVSGTGDGADQP